MAPKRPFVADARLTAIAVGYKNPAAARIADAVLPRQPVGSESFKWTHYPTAEAFQTPDARVGRKGRVAQIEFTGEERTSSVEDYGLETPIPYTDITAAEDARNAGLNSYDPEGHSVTMLSEAILNIREVRAANLVFNAASYPVGNKATLSGTDQWDDYANSNPITVLKDGMNSTLVYQPNTMVFGREVWSFLSSHPKVVNAVKGNLTSEGIVTREQFAALFAGEGIQQVLVGNALYNAAKPGQTASLEKAWGKHAALLYVNPQAMVQSGEPTFGVTAQYGSAIAGRIEDENIGLEGGVRIRRGERVKELIVAPDTGFFIQNAIG